MKSNALKKNLFATLAMAIIVTSTAFTTADFRYVSKNGHISFYSHTDVEDITAHNYKVVSSLDPVTGEVAFSAPMQAFEFELALMQKHFNSPDFLNTKKYPKSKFKGTITNLSEIQFGKNGVYTAHVQGELEIRGVTKRIKEKGSIQIEGDKAIVNLKMSVVLADYNITFLKGKPSTNVAKTIQITVQAEHEKQAKE